MKKTIGGRHPRPPLGDEKAEDLCPGLENSEALAPRLGGLRHQLGNVLSLLRSIEATLHPSADDGCEERPVCRDTVSVMVADLESLVGDVAERALRINRAVGRFGDSVTD